MSGSGTTSAAAPGRLTCTACPLLCDDILPASGRFMNACTAGAEAMAAAAATREPSAQVDGVAIEPAQAIGRAAKALVRARRVLVTGLADATLESVALACDLAEAVDGAVDAADAEVAQMAGPTVARIGGVTADWEELRDRADLVVFWFCDPHDTHPRFVERFVRPAPAQGVVRRTIAVGPAPVLAAGHTHLHLPLPREAAIDAARLLQALLGAHEADDHETAAACDTIRSAVESARCVAFVTHRGADPVGLVSWSVTSLVQALAHSRPAFEVPLGAGLDGGGANAAGAVAVCTWRYGAGGAIAAADRQGADFRPGESDARRLVASGEIDCVLAVGRLPAALEKALTARGSDLSLIRVATAFPPRDDLARPAVRLRCASSLAAPSGTMLRGDGRRITLSATSAASGSMTGMLTALVAAVRAARDGEASP